MLCSIAPTRRLNLLLLAALVHYVNACPCGCLEHHALYQAWLAYAEPHKSHSHGHETQSPAINDSHDAHCHGCEQIVFTSSRHGSIVDASLHPPAAYDASEIATPPRALCLLTEYLTARANQNLALGICAELQVLLI